MRITDEMRDAFYSKAEVQRTGTIRYLDEALTAALAAKARQGGAVNRMLLEQMLQNAFFAGRGTSVIVSPEDMAAWQDYDYTKLEAYKRLRAALEAAALSTDADPVKTAPTVAVKDWSAEIKKLREYRRLAHNTGFSHLAEWMEEMASALSAQVQDVAVPAGWKLVPVEPTTAMILAYNISGVDGGVSGLRYNQGPPRNLNIKAYKSMLSASPTPPADTAALATEGGE